MLCIAYVTESNWFRHCSKSIQLDIILSTSKPLTCACRTVSVACVCFSNIFFKQVSKCRCPVWVYRVLCFCAFTTRQCRRRHCVCRLSDCCVRPFICSSGQILLPWCFMSALSNVDETYREYSIAPVDNLRGFWRPKVKVTEGRRGGVIAKMSKSSSSHVRFSHFQHLPKWLAGNNVCWMSCFLC